MSSIMLVMTHSVMKALIFTQLYSLFKPMLAFEKFGPPRGQTLLVLAVIFGPIYLFWAVESHMTKARF